MADAKTSALAALAGNNVDPFTDLLYIVDSSAGASEKILPSELLIAIAASASIIGGDFTTNPWQRGTTFTAPATGAYTADRFSVEYSTAGVVDILKTADAPTAAQAAIFTQHCLHADVTTADASIAAGDYYAIRYFMEGLDAAKFGFGQAGTRYFPLAFWVKSGKTGVHCVSIANSANNRSYVAEYSVAVADTWELKTVMFPVDTTGTWLYDTGTGLRIRWALAGGSTYQTTASAWAAGNFFTTSNQVNCLDSTANNFKIALVNPGLRNAGEELLLCQRYLPAYVSKSTTSPYPSPGYFTSTTNARLNIQFPVKARVAATGMSVSAAADFTVQDSAAANLAASAVALTSVISDVSVWVDFTVAGGTANRPATGYINSATGRMLFTGCELT